MELNKCVDYTLLRPESTITDFIKLCQEAKRYPTIIRSVYVLPDPRVIRACVNELGDSGILVGCVNDFPLGRGGPELKQEQAMVTIDNGADENDTVINTGALREGKYKLVFEEIKAVTGVFLPAGGNVKVIIETGHQWYTEYLIKKATEIVAKAGAFCVKTSTGFIENIPVEEKALHVQWMHEAVPELVKKVAGGVKKPEHAQLFFDIIPVDKLIFGASFKFWPEK